jgi:hypothetical protein
MNAWICEAGCLSVLLAKGGGFGQFKSSGRSLEYVLAVVSVSGLGADGGAGGSGNVCIGVSGGGGVLS